jgi:hypothetical protein
LVFSGDLKNKKQGICNQIFFFPKKIFFPKMTKIQIKTHKCHTMDKRGMDGNFDMSLGCGLGCEDTIALRIVSTCTKPIIYNKKIEKLIVVINLKN